MKLHMANYQFAGVQVRKYPQPQQAGPWREEAISHLPSTDLLKQVFKFPGAL